MKGPIQLAQEHARFFVAWMCRFGWFRRVLLLPRPSRSLWLAWAAIVLLFSSGFLSGSGRTRKDLWLGPVSVLVCVAGGYCASLLAIRADKWERLDRAVKSVGPFQLTRTTVVEFPRKDTDA